jgi:hypothetical protein
MRWWCGSIWKEGKEEDENAALASSPWECRHLHVTVCPKRVRSGAKWALYMPLLTSSRRTWESDVDQAYLVAKYAVKDTHLLKWLKL